MIKIIILFFINKKKRIHKYERKFFILKHSELKKIKNCTIRMNVIDKKNGELDFK